MRRTPFALLALAGLLIAGPAPAANRKPIVLNPATGREQQLQSADTLVDGSGTAYATGGTGTVTSVALTTPAFLSVAGSPITSSGTLAITLATQSANSIFAGPTTGSPAAPTFRALVGADLPNPGSSSKGGVDSLAAVSHYFLDEINTSGVTHASRPACADLSDSTAFCSLSPTNGVLLSYLAQIGANTVLGNFGGSTANVGAYTVPSCPDTGGNHLNFVNGTGITCGTGGGGGGGSGISGLFNGLMSATPTQSGLGFSTWLNQGSATATDQATGITFIGPGSGSTHQLRGLTQAAPATPYTRTILAMVSAAGPAPTFSWICFGWYDGSNKLHLITYYGEGVVQELKFNTPSSASTHAEFNTWAMPWIWLRIADDGTNFTLSHSVDGVTFAVDATGAKSSGWLGGSGYSNLFLGLDDYVAYGWTVESYQ